MLELISYLAPEQEGQAVRAIPGQGTEVPVWVLGSSLYGAQLAAYLGLPFAFASHFAPAMLMQALEIYRAQYRPSGRNPKPHAMVGLNVIVADTDAEALRLFTSLQQRFLGMQRGQRGALPRPVDSMDALWTAGEKLAVERMLSESIVGSPRTVRDELEATRERTGADEFIVACAVHDAGARRRSYELLAGVAELPGR